MRSWLFVPASSEKKLARIASLDPDVVVLDLAGIAADDKADARAIAGSWLSQNPRGAGSGLARWVRIDGFDSGFWKDDIDAVVPGQPDGIILSDANDPEHAKQLAADLWEQEQSARVPHGTIHIVAEVATSAAGTLRIDDFAKDPPPRLTGLTWNAASLVAALGAQEQVTLDGRFSGPFQHVRSRVLLAARARGLMAVETPWLRWRNDDETTRAARLARNDGFTGMGVIHPRQIESVNAAFAPTQKEREDASGIVQLFEDNPEASAILYDGRMIDRPQLEHARRIAEQN